METLKKPVNIAGRTVPLISIVVSRECSESMIASKNHFRFLILRPNVKGEIIRKHYASRKWFVG